MKKLLILIVAALLIGGGVAAYLWMKTGTTEVKFKTEKLQIGNIDEKVTATGTINAVTTVLVGTQVSGTVKQLFVDYNTPVTKGMLIARIDPATFDAQVDQARANLLSAKANVEKSEAALVDAKRTLSRNKELIGKDLIAKSEYDTAETNYETAKAQVSISKAQVAQTEAALKLAETNLQYTHIISPVDGIVISRSVDVGQTVAASFQTPTLFTIAQDLTKMQIDTNVNEADIGKVRDGQPVEFTVDAYPDAMFAGFIKQIRNAPIVSQNVVTYNVVIAVDNSDLRLKLGMTANVSIITAHKEGVLKIPNAALRYRPKSAKSKPQEIAKKPEGAGIKGPSIWVIKDSGMEKVKVRTGITDGMFTEMVEGSLAEGMEVITESDAAKETKKAMGPPPPGHF